jgi:membrane-associated phospholipid phosphatase
MKSFVELLICNASSIIPYHHNRSIGAARSDFGSFVDFHQNQLKLKDETRRDDGHRVVTTIAALTLSLVVQPAYASLALSSSTSSGNTSNFRILSRYRHAAATSPLRQGAGEWNTRKATTNNALLQQLSLSKSTTSSIMISTKSDDASSSSTDDNSLHTITTIIGKTASLTVSISFFVLLAYHRNATIFTLWIGSILNAVLSKIIKKIVNQNRPSELRTNSNVKLKPSDGGMPSSHAMSLGFIITSILIVNSVLPINNYNLRVSVGLIMSLYTTIALRYRIRDHYHTIEQVVVGLVFGVMNAIAWYKFAMVGNTSNNNGVGPVLSYVQQNFVSTETGMFPYIALTIPIVVGIIVVGSFERRISLWMTNNKTKFKIRARED